MWDVYLVEGSKTTYRVCLAILKLNEKDLANATSELQVRGILDVYAQTVDCDELIKTACGFTFSKQLLADLELKYESDTSTHSFNLI